MIAACGLQGEDSPHRIIRAFRAQQRMARSMRSSEVVMTHGIELVEDPSESQRTTEEHHPGRWPRWLKWIALAAGIACALLLFIYSEGAERRAIRGLSEPERHALLARTLQNLNSICSPADDAMRDFCREQARLAMEFPECDKACQELADRQLSRVQLPR
jgi:hypothetical protein